MKSRSAQPLGFTIVEILITIAILGMLVAITYFSIGNWRSRSAADEVKNDLHAAVAELENYRNFNTDYPEYIWSIDHTSSPNVSLDYVRRVDGSFCLNGTSTAQTDVNWYVDSRNGKEPASGTCS